MGGGEWVVSRMVGREGVVRQRDVGGEGHQSVRGRAQERQSVCGRKVGKGEV